MLGIAHIRVEERMRERLSEKPDTNVFSEEFICWLHGEFYSHLPETEKISISQSGGSHPLAPGSLREYNVTVGRHVPPDHDQLSAFLSRFGKFYSDDKILETERLLAAAAAHHRLAWIHPFGDGNGRVARLQSQAAMIRAEVDGDGLWTLSRGLARDRPSYYRFLAGADQRRANDYDGRGNLSDRALAEFCEFFLRTVLDQIQFMLDLVAPNLLVGRMERYLKFVRVDLDPRMRDNFEKLLKALILEGPLPRGAVAGILNLKDTAARDVIRKALSEGLVTSKSEKGQLMIAFPLKVREYYFPNLFTDLTLDR